MRFAREVSQKAKIHTFLRILSVYFMHYFLGETHIFKMEGKFSMEVLQFYSEPEIVCVSLGTCRKTSGPYTFFRILNVFFALKTALFLEWEASFSKETTAIE